MKLSIMVTSYNCIESIDNAIASIMNQYKPFEWELLIGDDGSTDGTIGIIEKWCERFSKNIKLLCMTRDGKEEKTGVRAARNRANLLKHACGEYLAFLDGDDQLTGNDKFVKQIKILDDDIDKRYSCVAHNILANDVQQAKMYLMVENSIKSGEIETYKYWKSMYFHTNTIVFRACCKEHMLEEPFIDFLNDNFITFIILQYGQIYYLSDSCAIYNITGNGLWTGKKRVYGCFRNIMLYDLETKICPKLKSASYHRHLYDLIYISRNYEIKRDSDVFELMSGRTESLFPVTNLLMKGQQYGIAKRLKRLGLVSSAELYNILLHVVNIKSYILRKRCAL